MAKRNPSTAKRLNERIQRHPDGSKERWRDVSGYVGFYRVSDCGRVKSLTRIIIKKNRWGSVSPFRIKSRILKQVPSGGYLIVSLHDENGIQVTQSIHTLILQTFVGPCPDGMECRHFPDRDATNNRLSNIQWGTYSENTQDKIVHGTQYSGDRCHFAKLTEAKVRRIRILHRSGQKTISQLVSMFSTNWTTIYRVVRNKTWKHIP